jgi:hypothetical protein
MVDVAVKYRAAVDEMVADKVLGLREHKLGDEEWALLDDLICCYCHSPHSQG